MRSFYLEAYDTVRNITGIGQGKGPIIAIHDGLIGLAAWEGFLTGADRLGLDSHYYFAFSRDAYTTDFRQMINRPCQWWASGFNTSTNNFGLTHGGEWSLAPNDCGLWLNAVGQGSRYDGSHSDGGSATGSCDGFTDVADFSDTFKSQLQRFTLAQMDTFQNFMFWSGCIAYEITRQGADMVLTSQLGRLRTICPPADPTILSGAIAADSSMDMSQPTLAKPEVCCYSLGDR
jgi:glucan 1,3-beta-glucosidase